MAEGPIRVMHVQAEQEPVVVEVDGEAGICALLGGTVASQVIRWPTSSRELPAVIYRPAAPSSAAPNWWAAEADQPECGPRVIALLEPEDGRLLSLADFEEELWHWRVARWRLEMDARVGVRHGT